MPKIQVDRQDRWVLKSFHWGPSQSGRKHYLRAYAWPGFYVYMHRVIMRPPKGMVVDHINGDTFDNRRSNLRVCTRGQNNANQHAIRSDNTSGFSGVNKVRGGPGYFVRVKYLGKLHELGKYRTFKAAVRARVEGAIKIMGDFCPQYISQRKKL